MGQGWKVGRDRAQDSQGSDSLGDMSWVPGLVLPFTLSAPPGGGVAQASKVRGSTWNHGEPHRSTRSWNRRQGNGTRVQALPTETRVVVVGGRGEGDQETDTKHPEGQIMGSRQGRQLDGGGIQRGSDA